MSEAGDYTPAPHWKGYDFKQAKAAYKDVIDRSYDQAVQADVKVDDLVPDEIETTSDAPLVIVCDVTGSMEEWPQTIKSKLPYVEHEGKEYLGDGMRVSFGAVGDAFSDKFPVQVKDFVDGPGMAKALDLIYEKGGGGSGEESYDLIALYYATRCHMPDAIRKPIFILIGDEGIYSFVDQNKAKQWARYDGKKRLSPEDVFEALKQKFSVYIIRKPYGSSYGNTRSGPDQRIQTQWEKMLGEDHVVSLPDPNRVVDVIFGILARETDRVDYFEEELKDRQGKDKDGDSKIKIVMDSMQALHSSAAKGKKKRPNPLLDGSNSIAKKSGGPASIPLMEWDDDGGDDNV